MDHSDLGSDVTEETQRETDEQQECLHVIHRGDGDQSTEDDGDLSTGDDFNEEYPVYLTLRVCRN